MKNFILTLSLFIFTIGSVSAQSRFDQDKATASLYPNPATSVVTIKFDNPSKVNYVAIYSIIGNEVATKKMDGNSRTNFNIQNLKKGKYIVRITNEDGTSETLSLIKN